MATRRYDDVCGVARAMDIIGERWALLVVRELVFGPKRFSDLRAGLAGISQNVLSQRLKELEANGVVRRRRLGPPVGAQVYELTPAGQALEPVLISLSLWGLHSPVPEGAIMSPDAFGLMLKALYAPIPDATGDATVRLHLGGDTFDVELTPDRVGVRRASAASDERDRPGAEITATTAALRPVMLRGASLDDAIANGDIRIDGDRTKAERFFGSFAKPVTGWSLPGVAAA